MASVKEDRESPDWYLGYQARKYGFPRRSNPRPTKKTRYESDRHAQWFYGWDAAHREMAQKLTPAR